MKRASRTLKLVKGKDGYQGPSVWVYDPEKSKEPVGGRPAKPAAQAAPRKQSRRATGDDSGNVVPIRPDADSGDLA